MITNYNQRTAKGWRLTVGLCLLLTAATAQAQLPQKDIEVSLPEMYQQIDETIERAPQYIAEYEDKLDKLKKNLAEAKSDEQRLMLMVQLSDMYESFNGDSTLDYTLRSIQVAHSLGMAEMENDGLARVAYLCTFLGSQTEALTLLKQIDKSQLSKEGLVSYYRAYMMSYSSLGGNCKTPAMREAFHQQYQLYMDSLLSAAPEGSEMYYRHYEPIVIGEGRLDEALKMNDKRLDQTAANSHEEAIIAYSRYTIYLQKGDMDMAKYWLCRSALADVRNAVMDQTSLMALADLIDADGDSERASRYISFTWECNRRYSPHMRSWQIAPLLSAIEKNFQTKLDKKSHILTIYTICASGLLLLLIGIAWFTNRQRKNLKTVRAELEASNKKLEQTNHKLEWMNKKMAKNNEELFAINKKLSEGNDAPKDN